MMLPWKNKSILLIWIMFAHKGNNNNTTWSFFLKDMTLIQVNLLFILTMLCWLWSTGAGADQQQYSAAYSTWALHLDCLSLSPVFCWEGTWFDSCVQYLEQVDGIIEGGKLFTFYYLTRNSLISPGTSSIAAIVPCAAMRSTRMFSLFPIYPDPLFPATANRWSSKTSSYHGHRS